jgi:hypothetical protein
MSASPISESTPNKISGYDGYDVREAVRTLKRAEEIKGDAKFIKVVLKEMDKEVDKTEKAASVIRKTASKLKSTFSKGGDK